MSKNDSYIIEPRGKNGVAILVSIVAQVNMSKNDSYIIETLGKNGVAIRVSIVAQVNMSKYDSYYIGKLGKKWCCNTCLNCGSIKYVEIWFIYYRNTRKKIGVAIGVSVVAQVNMLKYDSYIIETLGKKKCCCNTCLNCGLSKYFEK